jgi:hypothetical protein
MNVLITLRALPPTMSKHPPSLAAKKKYSLSLVALVVWCKWGMLRPFLEWQHLLTPFATSERETGPVRQE